MPGIDRRRGRDRRRRRRSARSRATWKSAVRVTRRPGLLPEVVLERQRIADLHRQVARGPVVEHDRRRRRPGAVAAAAAADRRDRRRSIAVTSEYGTWRSPLRMRVGEVGQDRLRLRCPALRRRIVHRRRARRVEEAGGALDARAPVLRHSSDAASVSPTSSSAQRAAGSSASSATVRSPGVVARSATSSVLTRAGEIEILLQARQRHEHGADVALLRPQRELAEIRRGRAMARTSSRSVRPASSLRPCSDSIGIADGRSIADEHGAVGRPRRGPTRARGLSERLAVRRAANGRRRRESARSDRRRRRPARATRGARSPGR